MFKSYSSRLMILFAFFACAPELDESKNLPTSKNQTISSAALQNSIPQEGVAIHIEIPPPPIEEWSDYTIRIKNEFDLDLKAKASNLQSEWIQRCDKQNLDLASEDCGIFPMEIEGHQFFKFGANMITQGEASILTNYISPGEKYELEISKSTEGSCSSTQKFSGMTSNPLTIKVVKWSTPDCPDL